MAALQPAEFPPSPLEALLLHQMNLPFVHEEMKLGDVKKRLEKSGDYLLMQNGKKGLLLSVRVDRDVIEIPIDLTSSRIALRLFRKDNTPGFLLSSHAFPNLTTLCAHFSTRPNCIEVNGDEFRLKRAIWRTETTNRFGYDRLVKCGKKTVLLRSLQDEFSAWPTVEEDLEFLIGLKHTNIARLLDFKVYDQGPATPPPVILTVSEGFERNLFDFLHGREEARSMNEYVGWIYQAASGLSFLRTRGVYHRHLNARTCLLDSRNHLKLSDFWPLKRVEVAGQLRTAQCGAEGRVAVRSHLTMPPELLLGGEFTGESLVWSLANLIWHVFTHCAVPYRSKFRNEREFVAAGCRDEDVHLPGSVDIKQFECTDRPLFERLKALHEKCGELPRAPDSFARLVRQSLSSPEAGRPPWSELMIAVCKERRIYQLTAVASAALRNLT
ncbi:Receptor protein-tyrosine kinase [Aphelenchoides fujianensis]|nr:Receptor protein-tyrosine kinase [Aphelenchoides fujianensis]